MKSMTGLKQKVSKRMHGYGHLHKGKIAIYVRTWGLKRGEGICSKGAYFQELICISMCIGEAWFVVIAIMVMGSNYSV